jgi:hypothetical protein
VALSLSINIKSYKAGACIVAFVLAVAGTVYLYTRRKNANQSLEGEGKTI